MTLLIVGGTSTLGWALKKMLSTHHIVLTAGRNNCDVELDLSTDDMPLLPSVDVVIHTAASFSGKNDIDFYNTAKVNMLGTLKVCQMARQAGAKHVVYISSMFASVSTDAPSLNIYGLSKKHAEELAALYCRDNQVCLTVLRPSQIYGSETGHRKHQPFFYNILEKAYNNEDICFYGSNDAKRNYIHINDVMESIQAVIKGLQVSITVCNQRMYLIVL
jgi:nucleoside-diphosphate-sugar epimerase